MKMIEIIRYTFGNSSLGKFIAASSERGLVAFEFGNSEAGLLAALTARYPNTDFQQDSDGLADLAKKLEHLGDNPGEHVAIPLDPRGDDYQKRVWSLLQTIPAGETTNYGALAAQLGTKDARGVTEAIASNPIAILVPCHRVLKKDGSISGYRWGVRRKRALLEKEKRSHDLS